MVPEGKIKMPELRKDYVTEDYVIIATERSKRPSDFQHKKEKKSPKSKCPFCPENENMVPKPIVDEIKDNKGKWMIRVIKNKFPAVKPKGNPEIQTHNKYYAFADAYGQHEVVIETPVHGKELEDLPLEHIEKVIEMYIKRLKEISKDKKIKYAALFKNRGKDAGASISHSHSQIIAYNLFPTKIQKKLDAIKKYDKCPHCEIIESEKNSDRRCYENKDFVAFTPYASSFPFELWYLPKRHLASITEMTGEEIKSLAEMLKQSLNKLDKIEYPAFNIDFYNIPGENFHFHIALSPRLATRAGFEHITDTIINAESPEDAAKFYRGETE